MQLRPIRAFGALAVSMLLAACTTPIFTLPPGPQDFRVGYHDGCDAGYSVAGSPFYEKQDEIEPTRAELDYLRGWHRGFARCKNSYDRVQTTVFSILGPPL